MHNLVKGVVSRLRDLVFKFWYPLYVSWERLKLETSNLARILVTRDTSEKKSKLGGWKGSCDLFLKMWVSLHISGIGKARNCKFGTHIEHEGH